MAKMRKVLQIAIVLFILWAGIAFGQEITPIPGELLHQGQPAPGDGAFFMKDSVIALSNALAELRQRRAEVANLQAQVESLKGESEQLQVAIGQLKEANQKLQLANDKADFMISNFNVILGMYKQAVIDLKDDNKSLRNQLWWNQILNPVGLIGLVLAIMSGF